MIHFEGPIEAAEHFEMFGKIVTHGDGWYALFLNPDYDEREVEAYMQAWAPAPRNEIKMICIECPVDSQLAEAHTKHNAKRISKLKISGTAQAVWLSGATTEADGVASPAFWIDWPSLVCLANQIIEADKTVKG